MKFDSKERRTIRMVLTIVALSLILFALLLNISSLFGIFRTLWAVCTPFVAGLCIAFIVNMPMSLIERRLFARLPVGNGIKRALSLILAYLLVICIISFILSSVLPQLIASLRSLINNIPSFLETLHNYAVQWRAPKLLIDFLEQTQANLNPTSLWEALVRAVTNAENGKMINTIFSNVIATLTVIFSSFVSIFLSLIFSVYILAAKETLSKQAKELLYSCFSEKTADGVMYVAYTSYDNFYNFFTGQFLEAIALGIMCFAGMTFLNLPYAMVISVLIGFCALIPMVGAIIGAVVGCLLLLIESPISAIGFAVYIICLQQFDGNLVYPRIVGKSVGLPSMWVLFAITVGGSLFGILGMLIFVPITSTVYDLLTDFKTRRLASRNLRIQEK